MQRSFYKHVLQTVSKPKESSLTPAQIPPVTLSGKGYGPYPTRRNFLADYGFEPDDEACNLCPRRKGQHKGLLHNFIPAGKPVAQ
jgi:hypothetical protein